MHPMARHEQEQEQEQEEEEEHQEEGEEIRGCRRAHVQWNFLLHQRSASKDCIYVYCWHGLYSP
eukprot:758573-Hanusia_phi.AAC.2